MKKKKFAVVVFPGSNCDEDCHYVLNEVMKQKAKYVWHKETDLGGADAVVLPGGFSYGDYLRTGAVARFSPVMAAVTDFAKKGKPVIGICNGFQILLESGLLPGAMLKNKSLNFICRFVDLKVESNVSMFTSAFGEGDLVRMPIAHGEGNYIADPETLDGLKNNNQILLRYVNEQGFAENLSNPNGSVDCIAGICNKERNVFGLMPHPERASEDVLGSVDGRKIFESIINS